MASRELDKLPEVFANVNFKELIQQLEALKEEIPDKNQPKEKHRQFPQDLIKLWLNAFHLTPELVNIPEEELDEMNYQYFYLYWLMLQCKDSAVRVSPQTWSDIEDRMLLPPSLERI